MYSDDSGISFTPEMNDLWTIKLDGKENPYYAEISKDGSTVFIVVSDPRVRKKARILVYDNDGSMVCEIPYEYEGPQFDPIVKSSYDGSFLLVGNRYVYTREGDLVSTNPNGDTNQRAYISPDGSLICDYRGLYSQDFSPLSSQLIYGNGTGQARCPATGGSEFNMIFSMDSSMLGGCHPSVGLCRHSYQRMIKYDDRDPLSIDETPDGSVVLFSTSYELVYLTGGAEGWVKNASEVGAIPSEAAGDIKPGAKGQSPQVPFRMIYLWRVSISPGGGYATALEPHGIDYQLYMFDGKGDDPLKLKADDVWKYSQFFDVEATGTGVYYVSYDGKIHFGVFGAKGTATKTTLQGGDVTVEKEMKASGGVIEALGDFFKYIWDYLLDLFNTVWNFI